MTLPNARLVSRMGIDSSSRIAPVAGKCTGGTGFPRMRKFIESFTYKPGYEITLVVPERVDIEGFNFGPSVYAHLHIKAYLPDSTKFPHDVTLVQFQIAVPAYFEDEPDRFLRHWLRNCLREFENHEVDEWFRINGELVNDPHATQNAGQDFPGV